MTKVSKSMIVGFVIFLLPTLLFGEIPKSEPPKVNCPDDLQSALSSLQGNINGKKWTNIVIDACPQIQSEIINNVDAIVSSKEFELYLAIMNQETMRLVRNAFFALKGYKFEDVNLQKQFASFKWYKQSNNNNEGILTEEENRRVRLLKKIEEKWILTRHRDKSDVPPQWLPNGVFIKKGNNGKVALKLGKKSLDISSAEGQQGKTFFTVYGNNVTNNVLVCTQRESHQVDMRYVDKINLYSSNGKQLYEFVNLKENRIGGLEECPLWTKERPDVLVSYNNAGCCGATWDILATFDKKIKPIAVLNCGETACGSTSLFNEVNEGNLYLSVAASGNISDNKREHPFRLVEYDGDNSINNWSLWTIDKTGDVKLVVNITESVHNVPITPQSWNVIVDVSYPRVDLMAPSKRDIEWGPDADVLTSYKNGNILILYRATRSDFAKYKYSTTVVPLP